TCTVTEARDHIIRRPDGTSYYVDGSSVRHWIPNGGTYNCLSLLRGRPLINNVTQDQVDAIPEGGHQVCLALLVGPDQTSFYVDQTGERHWVPDGDTFVCLERRGVPVYRYNNWDTINRFDEHRDSWASC
uniref:hypothetical protein n=1 Tax=Euzebya rosea TaxID=2052804 RepID=UPI0013005D7D